MTADGPLRLVVRDATGAAGAAVIDRLNADHEVEVIGPEDPDASLRAIADGSLSPDLAVIVVDVEAGLDTAARREAYAMSLVGVRAAAFAIVEPGTSENDAERYHAAARACAQLALRIGLAPVSCFSVPGRQGRRGEPTLREFLDEVATAPPDPVGERGPELPDTDQIRATIVWTHAGPLLHGRSYTLRTGETELAATVAPIKHRLDLDTLKPVPATQLECGQIGECDLELSASIPATPYRAHDGRGGFVVVDPRSDEPAGLGLVRLALRRAEHPRGPALTLDGATRAARLGQTPCVLWLAGPSGAGQSMLANQIETDLHARGHHTYVLDGGDIRDGLNRDLGFTGADRVENIRRVAQVARLMIDAGLT